MPKSQKPDGEEVVRKGGFRPPDERPSSGVPVNNAALAASLLILLAAIVIISSLSTGLAKVEPGQVGVLINNLTGSISTRDRPGFVAHLPFGLTDIYILDKKIQSIEMANSHTADEPQIKIKSNDGTDVLIDATITYTLDPLKAEMIFTTVGADSRDTQESLISYTRSVLRDELGRLSIEDVIDAGKRNAANNAFQLTVEEKAERFGIDVNTIAVQNPTFNEQYEELISLRKRTDQNIANQKSAQERAREDQKRQIAEAERAREVAILEIKGQQERRRIQAQAEAGQQVRRARGERDKLLEEGRQKLAVAQADAKALREEGLKRAEGIRQLAEAYREGGLGLVREALAAKYAGQRINGRPYSLDSNVERLRLERAPDESQPAAKQLQRAETVNAEEAAAAASR